ncbi:MAG: hypothetical protein RIS52_310 [Pseudomonadota bacterium]
MKALFALTTAAAFTVAAPAFAAPNYLFTIPAQHLDGALIALGEQAQISIGGIDPTLARVWSNPVRGRMSVRQALTMMLRNTGFTFEQIDSRTYRIVRAKQLAKPAAPKRVTPKPPQVKKGPEPARPIFPTEQPKPPEAEIIVTASKQDQELNGYPGTVHIEKIDGIDLGRNFGTTALLARIPAIASTNLGPGRNKLFVRGIADSSFSGPTQSTVGLYLGEQRITYNAPEPDLRLYDVDRVEVIEGPQGTLYGAGTLGGVVRIMPTLAEMGALRGSMNVGRSLTQGGAAGFDLAGMVNIPLAQDRAALRVIGYREVEGGYIDNATLAARNTNRSKIWGARANLRLRAGDDWTLSLSAAAQNIDTADGQYAETDQAPKTHAARIAQPHDNDFKAINLDVVKAWGSLKLVSSTGYVRHELSETFDATGAFGQPGTLAYTGRNDIRLFAHETRLSRRTADGGTWVAGVSLLRNVDQINRSLGPPGAPTALVALRNSKSEIAVFGEATRRVAPQWFATLGGRMIYASTIGELSTSSRAEFEPRRAQLRVLPTVALSWRPNSKTIGFLRYQSGFRSGGIEISGSGLNTADRFESDTIQTLEMGLRIGGSGEGNGARLSGGVTGFASRWSHIQADLINTAGLPYTANIGRGTLYGLEANGQWRVTDGLTLGGAVILNHSGLTKPSAGFDDAGQLPLPNIAKVSGSVNLAWAQSLSESVTLKVDGSLRYIGASRLGTAPPLILEHGETLQADLSVALGAGPWTLTLEATNLLDAAGNSFSYGNPFTVAQGKQTTPLRPRSFRLSARVAF